MKLQFPPRRTAIDLLDRITDLILRADRGQMVTRKRLAIEWGCTPRAVSYALVHAQRKYKVRFRFVNANGKVGYALESPGIFDLTALRKVKR